MTDGQSEIGARQDAERMELTERQADLVEAIREHWKQWGYGPSFQDLADKMLVSKAMVQKYVELLVARGVLLQTPRVARSLRIADKIDRL